MKLQLFMDGANKPYTIAMLQSGRWMYLNPAKEYWAVYIRVKRN